VKRISFWVLSTLSALVLLVGFDASQHTAVTATTPFTSDGTTSGSTRNGSGQTSGNSTGSGNSSQSGTGSSSSTKTVTGAVAQTQWGPVQVQLVVKNGTITSVRVLQYPTGNSRDAEINNYALPILIQETTQAQSAQIDMVSGATVTSTGYVQSLQSALDQANL
jgi:uncharacterized protein with FMN-binding domain